MHLMEELLAALAGGGIVGLIWAIADLATRHGGGAK